MLKQRHQLVQAILVAADAAATAAALASAFVIYFHSGLFDPRHGIPPLDPYLALLPGAIAAALVAYYACGLYEPRRTESFVHELFDLGKATAAAVLAVVSISFFARQGADSRGVVAVFAATNPLALALLRGSVRAALRAARRRGYNRRAAIVVGTGKLGQRVAEKIARNPWTGIELVGYVDARAGAPPRERVRSVPVLGRAEDLARIVEERGIDQVFIALPFERARAIRKLVDALAQHPVAVALVPDLLELVALRASVADFDGVPIIHLREGPLHGLNLVLKRALDIAVAAVGLVLAAPVFAACAAAIAASDGRPIFYRQERMGLDGRRFFMLKFRTMRRDAEADGVARWAERDDPRTFPVGRFLRRFSLDELPQLLNVLRGEMSIVGPRPERPALIEKFKRQIPRYMLRHATKAGITGWAQVNGWRGNTSLKKRIQYDLYYIENWSILFDLKIMALTLVRGFRHPNAY